MINWDVQREPSNYYKESRGQIGSKKMVLDLPVENQLHCDTRIAA